MRSFIASFASAVLLAASAASAQQPKIDHAQLSVVNSGDLQSAIAAAENPTWIGYLEPAARPMQDWDNNVQYLEGRTGEEIERTANDPNESTDIVVLLRVLGGRVVKVSIANPKRTLDGGGLPFVWINNVNQPASLRVLSTVAEQNVTAAQPSGTDHVKASGSPQAAAKNAVMAMSMHSAPEATASVRSFTADRYPLWVRENAAFWLANERGHDGFEAIKGLAHSDHDDTFRTKLMFDLSLVKGDSRSGAMDELIAAARSDASPAVRRQAQFWLAQQVGRGKADARVTETLRDQAENDSNTAIRKSAVFALSRLPGDQAATELIRVASTTKDLAVRREAVFWLGQNKDPHALDYLEKLAKQ